MNKEIIHEQLTDDLIQLQAHLTRLTLKDYKKCVRSIIKLKKLIEKIYGR